MTYCLFISKNFHQSQRLVPHYILSRPDSKIAKRIEALKIVNSIRAL